MTRYTEFPKPNGLLSSLEVYKEIYPTISTPRSTTYFSCPITSGGAIRLYEGGEKPISEVLPTIIRLNGGFVEALACESEALLCTEEFTLPNRLHQSGWRQSEYSMFWMYDISGVNPKDLQEFDEGITGLESPVNLEVLNDHDANSEIRRLEYGLLIHTFNRFLRESSVSTNPVTKIVCVPDNKLSLGCSIIEANLAQSLCIPVEKIMLNKNNARFENFAESVAPWLLTNPGIDAFSDAPEDELLVFQPLK